MITKWAVRGERGPLVVTHNTTLVLGRVLLIAVVRGGETEARGGCSVHSAVQVALLLIPVCGAACSASPLLLPTEHIPPDHLPPLLAHTRPHTALMAWSPAAVGREPAAVGRAPTTAVVGRVEWKEDPVAVLCSGAVFRPAVLRPAAQLCKYQQRALAKQAGLNQ